MAVFSTNQVNQVFVVRNMKGDPVAETDPVGTLSIDISGLKLPSLDRVLYFGYRGPGGVIRSDIIKPSYIDYITGVKASRMRTPLKRVKLTIDDSCLEVNTPTDCSMSTMAYRILVRNYISLSSEDVYIKHINVAYRGNTPQNRYKLLALETINSFSKEDNSLFTVYLEKDGTDPKVAGTLVEVTKDTDPTTLTEDYTGLVIEEKEQPWVRGKKQSMPINFELSLLPIEDQHFTLPEWAFVHTLEPAKFIGNGKKMADLEWFGYGERGDIYRDAPGRIAFEPQFLVDPTKEYDVFSIHYHYEGTCEDSQKSEKEITFILEGEGTYFDLKSAVLGAVEAPFTEIE